MDDIQHHNTISPIYPSSAIHSLSSVSRGLTFSSSDDDKSPVHRQNQRPKRLHLNLDSPVMFDTSPRDSRNTRERLSLNVVFDNEAHQDQLSPTFVSTPKERESTLRPFGVGPAPPPVNWNPFIGNLSPPSLMLNESNASTASYMSPNHNASPTNGLSKHLCKTLSFSRDSLLDFSRMSATSNITSSSSLSSSNLEMEFEVLGKLGGGTFGTVWKVKKRLDGIHYAVKIINQPIRGTAGRERVLKEVYALAAVNHKAENPHVVRYFNSWLEGDRLFIQTELCDMSLEDLLTNHNGLQQPEQVLEMLRHTLTGLQGLHLVNLVHLDIKPANIFVKQGVFKLGDLGHAAMALVPDHDISLPPPPPLVGRSNNGDQHMFMLRQLRQQQKTAGLVVKDIDEGDSRYMPRELLQERHDQLTKADIFSLGISAYQCFLRDLLPAQGDEWAQLRDGVFVSAAVGRMGSHFVHHLLQMMMDKDPSRRPAAETLLVTGGPGGILRTNEDRQRSELEREVVVLRDFAQHSLGLAVGHGMLRRANTM